MSFSLFADSGCNLPERKLKQHHISVVPFPMEIDGKRVTSPKYPDGFDGASYYTGLKAGMQVKTSLINSESFYEAFLPEIQAGRDLMYVGISSGITGTVQSAHIAAKELMAALAPD